MPPTPSSKPNQAQSMRTPQSKHRLNFTSARTPNHHHHPSPNPNLTTVAREDHPIEVIGRIRDYPDKKDKSFTVLQANPDGQTLRARAEIGYRDFSLDGVSFSEEEDLDEFYKKFVEERINGVKLGGRCTIMMYGPTGSGKSYTMFGCGKQAGIVYRSLRDILGDDDGEVGSMFVQVSVLEIYNEEIYDLLSSNGGAGGLGFGWPKGGGSGTKVRLEVMGKKAKNATYISGTEAGKISKEIQKVEKRRIVKSTLCNDQSSRSHCMIILDVPTVGGRLMLVDMAGSENIEQAGQNGFEAKMQTAKINQGNIALKRVVESIANGDSHVPFRDSKLTMLLQDSFEDDKSKILMILCASPDPKEIHKTICTLEYGAKAKCIVRGPHTPIKDKFGTEDSSAVILGSRIAAMDQFINKLQMENKLREKERNEAHKQLMKKEEEIAALRALIEGNGSAANEEEINSKVKERTSMLKIELEKKLEGCQRMAEEFVELERRRMEERILQQQQELEMLRRRLEEIEFELSHSRDENTNLSGSRDMDGSTFARRLLGAYADEEPGMVKSMDLDMGDQDTFVREVKFVDIAAQRYNTAIQNLASYPQLGDVNEVLDPGVFTTKFCDKVCLSTVFEEEEVEEEENKENMEEEVNKEVIEEKKIIDESSAGSMTYFQKFEVPNLSGRKPGQENYLKDESENRNFDSQPVKEIENVKDAASSRRMRIQNIFTLCGNQRELSQHFRTPILAEKRLEDGDSILKISDKENSPLLKTVPMIESIDDQIEVHVKWEASKGNHGKFITTLKVVKEATLADLRKLIEIYLGADNQAFTFLVLGDPSGEPVPRDKESTVQAIKLPICNNQSYGYLACLRPVKGSQCFDSPLPLTPLENKLPLTPVACLSQDCEAPHLSSTPLITLRRR